MVCSKKLLFAAILPLLATTAVLADGPSASVDDESAVRMAVDSYVKAFNTGNAKQMAAQWSPEGVYISRDSGERITGREALEKEFARVFEKAKDLKLEAEVQSIEFISPNVALERGEALLLAPEAAPERTSYSVVHVRRDGKWLIDRITEETIPENSRYENLKQLEWMIGNWNAQVGDNTLHVECNWASNNNYLVRAFTFSTGDDVQASGLQIIGWDAKNKELRSWLFDSEGGFVSGKWTQNADRWIVQSTATLPDGGAGSFTSVFRPLDADHIAWQKVNQVVDGEILPNLEEVVVTRQ